nr:MAG: hypothetical protein BECKTC1821E_GA0114239_100912 [Candidatus Kentron sp. TC]
MGIARPNAAFGSMMDSGDVTRVKQESALRKTQPNQAGIKISSRPKGEILRAWNLYQAEKLLRFEMIKRKSFLIVLSKIFPVKITRPRK